ncbi:PQQ-dependent sugar dehydrogenase [Cellulosimicrobium cellulans]|uniref:PQQ-dependent sugar dehydrogenase n=1 Tax=Cellulosimicrobium cellulans TaxID=1710 RepID=UPI0002FC41B5
MRASRTVGLLAAFAAVLTALTACTAEEPAGTTPPSASQNAPSSPATSTAEPGQALAVASRLEAPWSIAFHGGTTLISERDSGRILELAGDGTSRDVATIEDSTPMGEGGLLGIAVQEGVLYAYFTAGEENRLERYELTGEPGSLGLGEAETILDGVDAASYHNGGRIAFGPDGMLYVTVGDAGDQQAAQDRDSLSGKILRLTPDGGVPADNPFDGSPVYSYGHRNPQGIAWDSDGTMYASEFGQNTWDELNVIEPGGNYGWPEVEGIAGDDRFIDPVQQWDPADASPSGITVYDGSIWIANLRGERLREVPLNDLATSTEHFAGEHGRLRDVVVAPDGSLQMLTNNTDGRGDPGPDDDHLLRIAP